MRHVLKVAAQGTTTIFAVSVGVLAPMLGVLALIVALVGTFASVAQALDSTGGTSASSSAATTDVTGLGGSVAPATRGTGGSEYGVLAPKPSAPPKSTAHKTSHAAGRSRAKPKAPAPKPRPKPKPKPVVPPPTSSVPGVPPPAQTVSEGAVFPVQGSHSFGGPENRFGAAREGHIHEGQDVLADEGLQVVAPLGGTIVTTAYQAGGAGWYAAEQTVDGLDFFYAHCQASSLAVSTGETVKAGQAICEVGQTGDATGPHLHLEIWVGGWQAKGGYPIDPLPYLEAWEAAGG
jgi:murein DD-endopeptidase MepM/ murein hydrolase activator NlpD